MSVISWPPYCLCTETQTDPCTECRYSTYECDHPGLEVCTCRFCIRRFTALEVARAFHAGDQKPLKAWIAEWKAACTSRHPSDAERHALEDIRRVVFESMNVFPTPENMAIYDAISHRSAHASAASYALSMGHCLTDNEICSGKPDSACCHGCLRHAVAVLPDANAAMEIDRLSRQDAWAQAWKSPLEEDKLSLQPLEVIEAERVARIAAALAVLPSSEMADMVSMSVTVGLRRWNTPRK